MQLSIVPPRKQVVPFNFLRPVRSIRLGYWFPTVSATVPEASIEENRQSLPWESNVWPSYHIIRIFLPSPESGSRQGRKESSLYPRPFPLNGLHCPSAIL